MVRPARKGRKWKTPETYLVKGPDECYYETTNSSRRGAFTAVWIGRFHYSTAEVAGVLDGGTLLNYVKTRREQALEMESRRLLEDRVRRTIEAATPEEPYQQKLF